MENVLENYIHETREKLDKNLFSPLFVRLANILYINEKYDECISICKTGLEIYPDYTTAKLILLKALLKAEYLTESEIIFNEIKNVIEVPELISKLENSLKKLKSLSKQEKIRYSQPLEGKQEFKSFQKKINLKNNLLVNFNLKDFLSDTQNDSLESLTESNDYKNFIEKFNSFHFELSKKKEANFVNQTLKKSELQNDKQETLQIKFVTETLADIFAEQGNYKDAFESYNFILSKVTDDERERIKSKVQELENKLLKEDKS